MKTFIIFVVCCFVCLGLPAASFGLEFIDNTLKTMDEELEAGSVLGAGVLYRQRPYAGVDNENFPVPVVSLEYKKFFIEGEVFGYYLSGPKEKLRLGVVGSPRMEGYHSSDSSELSGMADRDWSLDGGLRLQGRPGPFDLTLDVVSDLLNEHQGQEVAFTASKKLYDGFLTPRAGIRWHSRDLVDHYYGVKAEEATASRPEYAPGSELEYVAGLTLGIPLGEKLALMGDVVCRFLGSEVRDSPIVDEDVLFRYVAGVVYRY